VEEVHAIAEQVDAQFMPKVLYENGTKLLGYPTIDPSWASPIPDKQGRVKENSLRNAWRLYKAGKMWFWQRLHNIARTEFLRISQ